VTVTSRIVLKAADATSGRPKQLNVFRKLTMAAFDHRKYRPAPRVPAFNRQWPDRELTHAPIWVSEDLRDGNQALLEPMTVEQKQLNIHAVVVNNKQVFIHKYHGAFLGASVAGAAEK
jgi:hypothetical protein